MILYEIISVEIKFDKRMHSNKAKIKFLYRPAFVSLALCQPTEKRTNFDLIKENFIRAKFTFYRRKWIYIIYRIEFRLIEQYSTQTRYKYSVFYSTNFQYLWIPFSQGICFFCFFYFYLMENYIPAEAPTRNSVNSINNLH